MSRTKLGWIGVCAGATLLAGASVRAATPNDFFKFCYSPAFAGWRNFLEPCIDGVIDGANTVGCPPDNDNNPTAGKPEQGWANAFRYVFNRGVVDGMGNPINDVVLLALANGDVNNGTLHLNLGVQVKNDKTFDNEDLVVFAFQFGPNRFGAITINPIARNFGAVQPPRQSLVKYYFTTAVTMSGQPDWTQNPAVTPGANFVKYAATSTADANCANGNLGNCTWDVEVRVALDPNSANNGQNNMPVPTRTYVGVSRVYHVGNSITDTAAEEFAWPPTNPNNDFQLDWDTVTGVPQPADWGLDFVNSTNGCNGVFVAPSDISISPAPRVNTVSTLTCSPHNNSIDGTTGLPITAAAVKAEFFHAPFGSASFGGFQLIGPSAVQTIPASSNGFPLTVQWNPTQASDHECLLCRLSSTANGTTFINAGEFINSAVAAMSTATLEPRLSMKGVRPRKGGGPQKVRLSTQARFQFAFADGKLAEIPAGTLVAQLDWVFLVAHDTGLTITILENPIPITEPLPSYSITLQHALLADFQKAFEERHQKELAVFLRERNAGGEGMGPIVYRRANEILARVEEKPNPADFKTEVKGVTPVANSGSMLYDVEIPEGGEIVVPTTGTYVGGGGVCQSCWCCLQTKSTPAFAFISFGLIMFVGVFAYRRRT